MLATVLKSLLFLILVPGLLVIYVPLAFLRAGPQVDLGPLAYGAVPLWLVGWMLIAWCFWDFTFKGHGTPAPIDPPKELLVTGPYRFVRNPMYVGVELALLGNFLWFGYWLLLAYTAFFFIAFSLFLAVYEEPNLRGRFGPSYEEYLRRTPRWIPRFVPISRETKDPR